MKRFVALFVAIAIYLPTLAGTVQVPIKQPTAYSAAVAFQAATGNPKVKVWVNTASGVYHCPGTRWYGATKHGEYMSQAEAQKKGYRPAYGKVCQ